MSLSIKTIDFDAAAARFAKLRGMPTVAPCYRAAIEFGAALAVESITSDIRRLTNEMASAHNKTCPDGNGHKSGTLQDT